MDKIGSGKKMDTQVVEGLTKYGVVLFGVMGLTAGIIGSAQGKLNITQTAENSIYTGVLALAKPGLIAIFLSVAVTGLAVFIAKYILNKTGEERAKSDRLNIKCKIEVPSEKGNGQDKSLLPAADIKKPSEPISNRTLPKHAASNTVQSEILDTLTLAQENLIGLIKQYPAPDQWHELLIKINAKISSLYDKEGPLALEKIEVTQVNVLLGSVTREVMLWKLDRLIGKRTLDSNLMQRMTHYRNDLYAISESSTYLLVENKHYTKICTEIETLFVSD